jgi:hypothetical protein
MANGQPSLVPFHPFEVSGSGAWQAVMPLPAEQFQGRKRSDPGI